MQDTTTTEDLEKLRDEKCEPIARAMFSAIASDMFSTESNQVELVKKLLTMSLNEDLNITTEVSYIFQLMLGALSGLNKTMSQIVQESFPTDNERYGKIATQIMTMVSDANVRLTNVKPEDVTQDFGSLKVRIAELCKAEGLSGLEIKYIIQELIFAEFTSVNNLYSSSLEASSEKAEAKLFGIGSMSELTLRRLNEVLLAGTQVQEEAKEAEVVA